MEEKMKASYILTFAVVVIFCCTGVAFSGHGSWKGGLDIKDRDSSSSHRGHRSTGERSDRRDYREAHERHDTHGRGHDKKDRDYRERGGDRGQHDAARHHGGHSARDVHSRDNYRKHDDYHGHKGYRERPYDRGRHYGHYKHKGHRYDYRGHWRSWEQWDRYAKQHPDIRKHGDYYRDGGAHLMFRFCDPLSGSCAFFSIGR